MKHAAFIAFLLGVLLWAHVLNMDGWSRAGFCVMMGFAYGILETLLLPEKKE